jgi:hypothetical protein
VSASNTFDAAHMFVTRAKENSRNGLPRGQAFLFTFWNREGITKHAS